VSDAQKEQLLVNLRPHVVEVHLPDRVETVGPLGSTTITESSPQVDELVRRGLLALRDPETRDPETEEREREEEPEGGDAEEQPPARRTGRARGSAAAKRGGS
jgi:hypothetical protein